MMENNNLSLRFRKIPRQPLSLPKLEPLLDGNLEQWPHLNQLVQCYGTEWIKDVNKYGHYETTRPDSFQTQIFEGPDTDTETEFRLASARSATLEEDVASVSGTPFTDSGSPKHFGQPPLPAYEPAFDWENERSMIFGQRTPESPAASYSSGLKISVRVLSLAFQSGLAGEHSN
ncbi:hypothetical protein N665_0241s0020 [Sinapis alba]|nr:hypothetical protein N665_0241s0020 [Sinapis alba]